MGLYETFIKNDKHGCGAKLSVYWTELRTVTAVIRACEHYVKRIACVEGSVSTFSRDTDSSDMSSVCRQILRYYLKLEYGRFFARPVQVIIHNLSIMGYHVVWDTKSISIKRTKYVDYPLKTDSNVSYISTISS